MNRHEKRGRSPQTGQRKDFFKWLDKTLKKADLSDAVAINFNLYEDGENQWSAEFIGTGSFDGEDSDWACDEVFVFRKKPFKWKEDAKWESVQDKIAGKIQDYLENGVYAYRLKELTGVGVGFVDGDITVVYRR